MDMADLIVEVKTLKSKIKDLEADQEVKGGGDSEKVAALEAKIEALEKKLAKPLEDSDFGSWD